MDWEHFKDLYYERDTYHIISVSKRKMFPHLDAFWQIKFSEKIGLSFFTPHFFYTYLNLLALRPKYKLIIHSLF